MKSKQLIQKARGFTIIEVMIVLTIAGLIMLIVFLAVPALQRNSRNTQRKNDVAGVLAAFNEYASNNQGSLPTCLTFNGSNQAHISAAAAGSSDAVCAAGTGAITINQTGQFSTYSLAAYSAGQSAAANVMKVYTAAGCNVNALQSGGARSIAALYQVEPAADQCTAS
jgi:prepilin-type N-terminal cleavage/methylation domain-containing protein